MGDSFFNGFFDHGSRSFLLTRSGWIPFPADHFQETLKDPLSVRCEDRFWMKLYAFHRVIPVPNTHDFPLLRLGTDLQARGKGISFQDQGMITASD